MKAILQICLFLGTLLILSACGGDDDNTQTTLQESTTLPQPDVSDKSLQPPQAPSL
jgi:hypothetical protein